MTISKKEQNEIINATLDKFRDVKIISYEYVTNFLMSIIDGKTAYDGMAIEQEKLKSCTNLIMELKYIIQNSIYHKLCVLSNDDIDILLFLVEDKRNTAKIIMKKMGDTDFAKLEDYLIEAINNFRGDENFNTYLTRYIMAKVRGIPFAFKSNDVKTVKEQIDELSQKKKKGKKVSSKGKMANIDGDSTEVRDSNDTDSLESVRRDEVIEEDKEKGGEVLEQDEINPYFECIKRCKGIVGTGCKDNLVIDAQKIEIVKRMENIADIFYEMYLLLRLGYINRCYYTKEEISKILGISIFDVINYERDTWEYIRGQINNQFNRYEKYLLSKVMLSS